MKCRSDDVEKITLLEQNVFNTDMYANFFCDGDVCLLDYLAQNCLIFLDESSKILDNAKNFYDDCYLHCIGNLVLIGASHNAAIGNKPFKDKLASYENAPIIQQRQIKEFAIGEKLRERLHK